MSITTFDTLKFARQLKDAGVPEKQAEAQANAMSTAFSEALDAQVATKADVVALKSDIANVRSELKGDIASLRSELKSDIKVVVWMLGLVVAVVAVPLIKSFLG